MSRRFTTVDGFFGTKLHYDGSGKLVGQSVPGLTKGTMLHYDMNGNIIGRTDPGFFGTQIHTDKNGRYAGTTCDGWRGQKFHSTANGGSGESWEGLFGAYITEMDD